MNLMGEKLTFSLALTLPLLSISFSPWNPAVHEEAKERMFTYKVSLTTKKSKCTSLPSHSLIVYEQQSAVYCCSSPKN